MANSKEYGSVAVDLMEARVHGEPDYWPRIDLLKFAEAMDSGLASTSAPSSQRTIVKRFRINRRKK